MNLLSDYRSLSITSSSLQVQNVLNAIIRANSIQISSDERVELVKLILDDLENKDKDNGRLTNPKDQPLACEALKTLGRSPDSAKIISTKLSLELLLKNTEVSSDIVRTIANALLLQAEGRQNFIDVGGGQFALKLLSTSTDPTSIFLASRLLFLMTHDAHSVPFMRELIDNGNVVEATSSKMDVLVKHLGSDAMAKEGLSDMMKYIYNIILHFSRAEGMDPDAVMGDCFSEKLNGWIIPLLSCFQNIPASFSSNVPLQPPMTHIIHCLLAIPTDTNKEAWYSLPVTSPTSHHGTGFFKTAKSLFTNLSSPTSPSSPKQVELTKRPHSRGSSPKPGSSPGSSRRSSSDAGVDMVQRCINIVSSSLEHYFPGAVEPDATEVREKAKAEGIILDELLSTPILLLIKLAHGELEARRNVKNWILPDDLDRNNPLESGSNSLGRLIRLLSSVYHQRLANIAGELIFTISDSDSGTMSSLIGYGNAAGFLFNKGILTHPPVAPSSSSVTSNGEEGEEDNLDRRAINPITGTIMSNERSPLEDMTEEEKELEAEKLFVLFDRMEKVGLGPNVIRRAEQSGELEKYKDN